MMKMIIRLTVALSLINRDVAFVTPGWSDKIGQLDFFAPPLVPGSCPSHPRIETVHHLQPAGSLSCHRCTSRYSVDRRYLAARRSRRTEKLEPSTYDTVIHGAKAKMLALPQFDAFDPFLLSTQGTLLSLSLPASENEPLTAVSSE